MKQGRDTTQQERMQIVKECVASGHNYGEMALKYQVSYQQSRTWTLRFEQMGEAGLQDREASGNEIRSRAPNWRNLKLRSNNSSVSYTCQKWRMVC